MADTFILAGAVVILLPLWWWLRRRGLSRNGVKEESLHHLQAALQSSQLTNDAFFRSLELVQKNLESLLARAENAEQRMRNLMLQPGMEKREQYTAAALLLAEGQEPHKVATMLNLPLPQVEIVQELQRMSGKEKRAQARKRSGEESEARENPPAAKLSPRREKTAQPILLVDVIKRVSNEGSLPVSAARANH